MQITGEMLIGASSVRGTEGQQQAFDPPRMDQFIATPTFWYGRAGRSGTGLCPAGGAGI